MGLTATGRTAHRLTIADITGLKLSIVDDHLKRMRSDGRLKLIERGKYIAIPLAREDRLISHTMLPDWTHKVEIGDDVMVLTMKEARDLSVMLAGITLMFSNVAQR